MLNVKHIKVDVKLMVMVVVQQLHVKMYNLLHLVLLLKAEIVLFVIGLLNVEMSNQHAVVSLQVDKVFVLLLNLLQDLVYVFGKTMLVQKQNVKIYH